MSGSGSTIINIFLKNVIIKANVNISSLVNYILNNAKDSYTDYRNLEINTSSGEDLTIKDNQFISKDTYTRASDIVDDDIRNKFHHIDFKIPIF